MSSRPVEPVRLTLYVAGQTQRSVDTVQRLRSDAQTYNGGVELTVVDVLEDPARAETDAVLTTPMLVRWQPHPIRRLTGDIEDLAALLPTDEEVEPASDTDTPSTPANGSAGALLSRAAHELRTPLAVMRGFADLLSGAVARDDDETVLKCADAILRGSAQLQTVLESMLVTAAVQRGGIRLDLASVHLGELVQETLRDLQPIVSGHSVSVDVIRDVIVHADVAKVRQIITNLVSNAAKFSPKGSAISVKVGSTDDGARIEVTDQGPGIPAGDLERVFEEYERLDSDTKGMGLGLYISRRLAEAHGGKLEVSSSDSVGSTFELLLPASPA